MTQSDHRSLMGGNRKACQITHGQMKKAPRIRGASASTINEVG
jgi:hypothetical protein